MTAAERVTEAHVALLLAKSQFRAIGKAVAEAQQQFNDALADAIDSFELNLDGRKLLSEVDRVYVSRRRGYSNLEKLGIAVGSMLLGSWRGGA